MAIIRDLKELEEFIPSKETWLNSHNNTYSSLPNGYTKKKLYGFFINPTSRKVKNAYRMEFVVYKGLASAFLIIVEYDKEITSKCPSVKKNIQSIDLNSTNEWGFEVDILGLKIKSNSPQSEYIIYFGEGIDDFAEVEKFYHGTDVVPTKPKVTIVTETVYV